MKSLYQAVLPLLFVSLLQPTLRAESKDGDDTGQKMEQKKEEMKQKKIERMTKELSLTLDQQTSVKAILDDKFTKTAALRKEFNEKEKAVRDEADKQIMALLNDDQKAKYEKMKADWGNHHSMPGKHRKGKAADTKDGHEHHHPHGAEDHAH